jgi:asparagine synthase (glutamine-hydrolysing)
LFQESGYDCLQQLNGMFAIAIWDNSKEELFLARDRIGKKPLYYYYTGKDIVFASEIKAILQVDNIPREIQPDALYDYFTYQYIPEPKTIFKNIYKLPAGYWLTISKQGVKQHQYWDVSFAHCSSQSKETISDELLDLLRKSTEQRLLSDVPLGAFLSGGVDSSAVVAFMAEKSTHSVTTCSIGFNDKKYDEGHYAKIIAQQFSTNHYELTVKANVAAHIEDIVAYFDEPFADPSSIPTYYVAKLAREKVTVALAGDGGDENFAGYDKYGLDQLENRLRYFFPQTIRHTLFPFIAKLLAKQNNVLLRKGYSLLNTLSQNPATGFFLSNAFCSDALWNQLAKKRLKSDLADYHPSTITENYYHQADTDNHLSKILYTDLKTYLCGDILVKVDRMSMANSLEVRAPLLDFKVLEYAAQIPSSLKLHQGEKKYILKESLKPILTSDILYRKKMGFSVPLANWFRHEIKEFAEIKLFQNNNGIEHFFNKDELKKIWDDHQSGVRDYSTLLWSFLMFELWFQKYM